MFSAGLFCLLVTLGVSTAAQENLLSNPGFEMMGPQGFFADWGPPARVGKTLFVEDQQPHGGKSCLRLVGTPHTWTTCSGKRIPVKPETTYWIAWWVRARQPATSRTYLFLQTNLAQRVFPHTDAYRDFDWSFHLIRYRTRPGETSLAPVLAMQTANDPSGTSWWDDLGVWEKLPPELEEVYRNEHPWEDVAQSTSQRLTGSELAMVWGDRPEARIYPKTPVPLKSPAVDAIRLVAPGRGHDVYQLVVTPGGALEPLSLEFRGLKGPGAIPAESLSYKVARCVPVQEVRDKAFPLGPTPDPLMNPTVPEPARPGENNLFWIEWAPPAGTRPGIYRAEVRILSGAHPIATVPLKLRCWGFDLPQEPHYRSMVMVSPGFLLSFYRGSSSEAAYRLAWDALAAYRLSGFNVCTYPQATLKDGKLSLDWKRFDQVLSAAKEYHASGITIGPMLGGGCSQGWRPNKFVGLVPLADKDFDRYYVELNRQIADRLRKAGLLDKAYVYPYDEPEPDYMDNIARLCDLVHQGSPDLKCLMTVDPDQAKPLWGKVKAWIIPSSTLKPGTLERLCAAGDEVWIYNMTAAIESTGLEHRTYLWKALRSEAEGGLLWNCCWWNKINPWENPTAAAVAVGRDGKRLFHYQAGQASLFYPDPDGKGPLVPSLRLVLIRQGVEDFDLLSELVAAWRRLVPRLSADAAGEDVVAKARAAFVAPVMLDISTPTSSVARTECLRQIVGNELEVATRGPSVIAYPSVVKGRLMVTGYAEHGTRLAVNGVTIPLNASGHFTLALTREQLAAGLHWSAGHASARKAWQWPGLQ